MDTAPIPLIDLGRWTRGHRADRERLAARVDRSLQSSGFLLVTGHGIETELPGRLRAAANEFFHLPQPVKRRYDQDRRGWIGRDRVTTARSEGTPGPPDLLEVWSCAVDSSVRPGGRQQTPGRWPGEVPVLHPLVTAYTARMRTLADTLLAVMATALGRPADFFTRHTARPHWDFTINWYPAAEETGAPAPGQFRVGPHTDFGLVTLLDREPGRGGLQVHDEVAGWRDAPFKAGAVTVNIGDLMARWSGDRWRSGRHRVLPPPCGAPQEELTSLVYFHGCAPDTEITSLPAPLGRRSYGAIRAGDYLADRMRAILH
ncbi:isopenicillin N synthase family dioxygenase [Kitasatospora sp. NPDC094019]|uniref:isopenicillin N synthase family dioxygenase n=1 Tax=Kitasatospora sp. NPDC094019 TaxID=3364091 RepID=UPI00381BC86D